MRLETALLCRAHLTLGHWHERASTMLAEVWLRRMIADGDSSNIVKAQQLSANAGRVLLASIVGMGIAGLRAWISTRAGQQAYLLRTRAAKPRLQAAR